MSEESGMLSVAPPLPQVPAPDASLETRFTMQTLVAGLFVLGMGSGGPKRQPGLPGYSGLVTLADVQLRLLPVSVAVVAVRLNVPAPALQFASLAIEAAWSGIAAGSGMPTPAPPKYSPPAARSQSGAPVSSITVPEVTPPVFAQPPLPICGRPVVKANCPKQQQSQPGGTVVVVVGPPTVVVVV